MRISGPADWVKSFLVAALYFAAAKIGFSLALARGGAISMWPPASGIALAVVLLHGYRMLPAVATGAFAAGITSGISAGAALGIALGNTAETLLAALLLQRVAQFRPALERLKDVLDLLLAAAASTPLSATAGVASLYLAGALPGAQLAGAWSAWWIGNALGILVLTPVMLGWGTRDEERRVPPLEAAGLLAAVTLCGVLALSADGAAAARHYPLEYLIFPLMVWAALRLTVRETASAAFIVSAIAVWATAQGKGPFAAAAGGGNYLPLDAFLAVAALTSLTLSAAITEHRRAEAALKDSADRFRSLTALSSDWYWEQDENFRFTMSSDEISAHSRVSWGYSIIGKTRWDLPYVGMSEADWNDHKTLLEAQQPFHDLVLQHFNQDGELCHTSVSGEPVFDGEGHFKGYRGVGRDITDYKLAEQRIEHLATRDPLTGLPNRLLLHDRLGQAITAAMRDRRFLAVLLIDLDLFKNINDSLGHHTGDLLLKEVARRLLACTRETDTVSRLGGDEFVVLLETLAEPQDAAQITQAVLEFLSAPYAIAGQMLNISCSIGIGVYPSDGDDTATLMKNADAAMYYAKEMGRNNYQFYSRQINAHAAERLKLENELRRAVRENQFVLHYQPQVDLKTGKLAGAEALIRWQHPERGLIYPDKFILTAEETGLISLIGEWALHTACMQHKAWHEAGLPALRMAVNVSVRQFDSSFLKSLLHAIEVSGLDPATLELEITESLLMHSVEESITLLKKIADLGIGITIDDFGTGYSSLSYLKRFPIDTIKIDRAFIRDLASDPDDAAIVSAIVALAHSLEVRVIAEGVEKTSQLTMLREMGCDEFQGYLLSKPLPQDGFAEKFLVPRPASLLSGGLRAA